VKYYGSASSVAKEQAKVSVCRQRSRFYFVFLKTEKSLKIYCNVFESTNVRTPLSARLLQLSCLILFY